MLRSSSALRPISLGFMASCCLAMFGWNSVYSAEAVLKNGMRISGRAGKIGSLMQNPNHSGERGGVDVRLIFFLNDELRRTYFSSYQRQEIHESEPTRIERITIDQRVADSEKRVAAVGTITKTTPWDEFGRRVLTMSVKGRGQIHIIQGITEITPNWTKVEGLVSERSVTWDMRIATSSIPRGILSEILIRQINADEANDRLRIVRLYTQAKRYADARAELDDVIRQFPELHALTKQSQALRQLGAEKLIGDIQLRKNAGQHEMAIFMLSNFPDEKIAGETLLRVRQMLDEYGETRALGKRVHTLLDTHLNELEDAALRGRLQPVCDQLKQELNIHNLDRMADYLRLADDEKMTSQQKLSLAISGWLMGGGSGQENLTVSLSLFEVRELVRQYLAAERINERAEILEKIRGQEGGAPQYVAGIVQSMRPPLEIPQPEQLAADDERIPGLVELKVSGLTGQSDIEYVVQLPPEYDPSRRYPAIVTLHSASTTPHLQIDWWAGPYDSERKMRLGQATRQGYVVIAPRWTRPHQMTYEFSAREHAAVLFSLRDACRRISIDTDRVYLSGHSMGGDACWDLGLAHPDMWAGMIPIVATSDKYVARYWENARHVPMYFVMGELDGNKLTRNVRDLDRYLTKNGFDCMVVEYLGRGHEHFQDEIHRIFQWMGLRQREFPPPSFECHSMRPWDNFFWWVELDEYPGRSMVVPVHWPPAGGVRPVLTSGSSERGNQLWLRTGAGRVTVWLSPDMVNFERRITVSVNGRNHVNPEGATPDTEVLLEDVRTRGDRQHPFWAKMQFRSARGRR